MKLRFPVVGVFLAALGGLTAWAQGCGSSTGDSTFDPNDPNNPNNNNQPVGDFLPGTDGGPAGKRGPCKNLQCKQVSCPGGLETTVSGTVYDPAGKVPLYNVLVYVPNAPLAPIQTGAFCDRCGSVSGEPIATALTDAKGNFVLKDVPVGQDIPLVIQVGKWRRTFKLPAVPPCVDTPITDKDLTRLPRNKAEGDIPLIAITTGGADSMECLPRRMGIDDAEFTVAGGPGRIHLYAGQPQGSNAQTTVRFASGEAFTQANDFWADVNNLKKYDVVILSCEGNRYETPGKPATAKQALVDYVNAGGRLFASHWHEVWFSSQGTATPSPFPAIGSWIYPEREMSQPSTGTIDTSFPKGQAFRDWMSNVGASPTPGQLTIYDARMNIQGVTPGKAQQWITAPERTGGGTAVEYLSFNAPVGAPDDQLCGRVVYSDLHVSAGGAAGQRDPRNAAWPTACRSGDLSAQEKALEFLLFDLSSCIQNDNATPTAPPPVK
jgi:hypothetical protein